MLKLYLVILIAVTIVAAWTPQMEDPDLFEGDMILSPEQQVEVQSGSFMYGSMRRKDRLWLNEKNEAIVPYSISEKLIDPWALHEIEAAIKEYHKYTCIKFIPRTNEQKYIHFYKGISCTSPVGRQGSNYIQLGPACWWRTTIMHEIGHSLGLYHEQSRPDRDDYVEILFKNMRSSYQRQFRKETNETIDSRNTKYDYLSMMHYGWSAFGNGAMTIRTKDPKYQYAIGQDEGFSRTDVFQLNHMYKCKGTYPQPPLYKFGPPGCYNLVGGCSRIKYKGKCEEKSYRRYVTEKCRKTCGICGWEKPSTTLPTAKSTTRKLTTSYAQSTNVKTESPPCVNRVRDCSSLGRRRCNDSSASWRRYMARSCRQYCNLCQ